jgi:hypothetical protein
MRAKRELQGGAIEAGTATRCVESCCSERSEAMAARGAAEIRTCGVSAHAQGGEHAVCMMEMYVGRRANLRRPLFRGAACPRSATCARAPTVSPRRAGLRGPRRPRQRTARARSARLPHAHTAHPPRQSTATPPVQQLATQRRHRARSHATQDGAGVAPSDRDGEARARPPGAARQPAPREFGRPRARHPAGEAEVGPLRGEELQTDVQRAQ